MATKMHNNMSVEDFVIYTAGVSFTSLRDEYLNRVLLCTLKQLFFSDVSFNSEVGSKPSVPSQFSVIKFVLSLYVHSKRREEILKDLSHSDEKTYLSVLFPQIVFLSTYFLLKNTFRR